VSTDLPTCYGCFVSPAWYSAPGIQPPNYIFLPSPESTPGLTDQEKEILLHLTAAWTKFSELSDHNPYDLSEFTHSIHMLQQKMAMRVARRIDPLIWRQPDGEKEEVEVAGGASDLPG
jgi:hypothetical protein